MQHPPNNFVSIPREKIPRVYLCVNFIAVPRQPQAIHNAIVIPGNTHLFRRTRPRSRGCDTRRWGRCRSKCRCRRADTDPGSRMHRCCYLAGSATENRILYNISLLQETPLEQIKRCGEENTPRITAI